MGQQLGQNKFLENALKYGFSLWGLPKTGQTIKVRTGDDGDFEKGYPRNPPRFVDNKNGTITDNATGLMWVKEPGAIGGNFGSAGSPAKMTWNNAIDECLALTYAGHSNWRLPNINELTTLLNYEITRPALDPIFTSIQSDWYWSSTAYRWLVAWSWRVYVYEGAVSAASNAATYYPRPVRLNL